MLSPIEVQAILDRLDFIKSHSPACQRENHIKRYDVLKRKTCACSYYACGVLDPADGFKRTPTGAITLEKAQQAIRRMLETGDVKPAIGPLTNRTSIDEAVDDFMGTVISKERAISTYAKYNTLMDQLKAFCKFTGIGSVQGFDQTAMQEFWNSWSDPKAKYKKGTKWTRMSGSTCKRNLKTMRLFFRRCIKRGWITADPSIVIEVVQDSRKKTKEQVKYLTRAQMAIIMATIDEMKMREYNKIRLKALILIMRWTGLRISDAVKVKQADIREDVLFVNTKKTKAKVQLPIPAQAMEFVGQLKPCKDDFLFWNRRSERSKAETPEHNFGSQISKLFVKAGVKDGVHQVSHRLRNTFAVHLLSKGVPLETVSLMLTHQNIQTTENYYADYSPDYMTFAEKMIRKVHALGDGERLDLSASLD